jgi:hypothetical protein
MYMHSAAKLVEHVADLSEGPASEGDQSHLKISGHYIWLAQQARGFASSATLDDLAATSVHFEVPLGWLRRTRELNWDTFEIPPEDRPDVIKEQRKKAELQLVAWLDALASMGMLTPENHSKLLYEVIDLSDDTSGKQKEPVHEGD